MNVKYSLGLLLWVLSFTVSCNGESDKLSEGMVDESNNSHNKLTTQELDTIPVNDNSAQATKNDLTHDYEFEIVEYPKYLNQKDIEHEFGRIVVGLKILSEITEVGQVVVEIYFYSFKNNEKVKIATITKNGILNSGENDFLFPVGMDPDGNFIKNQFVGFSQEIISNPFIIVGVAKNNSKYYLTDALMMISLDAREKKVILYQPAMN